LVLRWGIVTQCFETRDPKMHKWMFLLFVLLRASFLSDFHGLKINSLSKSLSEKYVVLLYKYYGFDIKGAQNG
jgi:hypothetical protein